MARSMYIYPSGTGWSSPKSKSHYDQRSVNQYALVPSPHSVRGIISEQILIRHHEVYIKAKFFTVPMGGLHVKHEVESEILVPSQNLLWDQEKPRKTSILLANCCKLTSSQQPSIKYANPNSSPYLCFFFFPFSFSPLKTFTSCFLQNVICI
jgi:hypothetical protein